MSNAAALGHSPLEKTLQNIVARLEDEKYVHGDLRTDNIMIRKDSPRESPDFRVVNFDWAGGREIKFVTLQTETQISSGLVKQEG